MDNGDANKHADKADVTVDKLSVSLTDKRIALEPHIGHNAHHTNGAKEN